MTVQSVHASYIPTLKADVTAELENLRSNRMGGGGGGVTKTHWKIWWILFYLNLRELVWILNASNRIPAKISSGQGEIYWEAHTTTENVCIWTSSKVKPFQLLFSFLLSLSRLSFIVSYCHLAFLPSQGHGQNFTSPSSERAVSNPKFNNPGKSVQLFQLGHWLAHNWIT